MHDLATALADHVDAVDQHDPTHTATARAAARATHLLVPTLGLTDFLGTVLDDAKPRLILRFATDPCGPSADLGPVVVLKVYGDAPRGEGPLLAHWSRAAIRTPRVRAGVLGGRPWLVLEHLDLTPIHPARRGGVRSLTDAVAATAVRMHAQVPQLAPVLRPLAHVMLPRWDAAVAALRDRGHDIPPTWRSRVTSAYRGGDRCPLHGDLALTNMALDTRGDIVHYDPSAFWGPRSFDGARWAARLADRTTGPVELLRRWSQVETGLDGALAAELLAAECILEAGSVITRKKQVPSWAPELIAVSQELYRR